MSHLTTYRQSYMFLPMLLVILRSVSCCECFHPQDIVLQLLKEKMVESAASSSGFLIDGYPREMEQGTRFEDEVLNYTCS